MVTFISFLLLTYLVCYIYAQVLFIFLNAAVTYLRELYIIAYYDVLPNVIFGSSQVILDKITELVHYSLKLKKGRSALNGAQRKFVQQGIVSLQSLCLSDVNKQYIPELFQPEDLLKVLISQLVVSAVGPSCHVSLK